MATRPSRVPSERARSLTILASAWLAPRAAAIPNAQSATCFIATPTAEDVVADLTDASYKDNSGPGLPALGLK
jgi:hypothetical protein